MDQWPWAAPVDDGAAVHLVAGTPLPQVSLASWMGVAIDLAALAGRAVVFVYPCTGTPGEPNPPGWDDIAGAHGSTPEAEGFRDAMAMFALKGVKVFGVSGQETRAQEAFARRCGITYPLLSDAGFRFADALGLPRFETGGVTYLRRLTLIVRDGAIERCIYPVHPPHTHAADVMRLLAWIAR